MLVSEVLAQKSLKFLADIPADRRYVTVTAADIREGVEMARDIDPVNTRALHEDLSMSGYRDVPLFFNGQRVVILDVALLAFFRRDLNSSDYARLPWGSPLAELSLEQFRLYGFARLTNRANPNLGAVELDAVVMSLQTNRPIWRQMAKELEDASVHSAIGHPYSKAARDLYEYIWWTAAANPSVSAATTSKAGPDWRTLLQSSEVAFMTAARNRLCETKKLSDLYTIATDMGIDYENIPGKEKNSYARELLDYLMRRSHLSNIIPYL